MAERRHLLARLLVSLFLLVSATASRADSAPAVRIQDLPKHLQSVVTVQGRTGYIAEQFEKKGLHVFTLRDDYNGQVFVRMPSKNYPVMGTTYRVVGYVTKAPGGTIFLDTFPGQVTAVYPLNMAPLPLPAPGATAPPATAPISAASQTWLWTAAIVSLLLAALVLVVALRRWLGRPQPEWGELFVTSGPDRGTTVPLRKSPVVLGRGVRAARHVRFSSGDQTISNEHARITYRRGELFLTDLSSNGTRVGGEKLATNVPKKINSGDLIHLGTRGTVVIVRLRSTAPAPGGLLSRLREPSPIADKTIMLPDAATEEPAWMRSASEVPAPQAEGQSPAPAGESLPAVAAAEHPAAAEATPAPLAVTPREAEAEEDEEEDSIPHTHLSPMIFSFAGHSPRGNHLRVDDGLELPKEADEETAAP